MKSFFLYALLFLMLLPGLASSQKKAAPKPKQQPVKNAATLPTESDVKKAYRAGDYSKAIDLAQARLAKDPSEKAMMVVQALSYGMLHNKEMVLKTVNRIYPGNDTAAIFLATMPYSLLKEVMKSDAGWYVAEAHKVSPRSTVVYLMEASYFIDDSMFDKGKASALAGAALLTDNDDINIQTQYARLLSLAGAKQEGNHLMARIYKSHPGDTIVLAQRYAMYLADKKYNEALTDMNTMISVQPSQSRRLHKERAFLYDEMGRHDDACNDASALVREDPDYFPLLRKLGCAEAFMNMTPALTKSYTYDVDYHGMKYKFIVYPKSIHMNEVASFDWSMTIRDDKKGHVTITKAALDTAHGQMNTFASGDVTLNNLTTVWLSNAVYNEIKTKGTTNISASDEGAKEFHVVKDDYDNEPTVTTPSGTMKALKTVHIRSDDEKEELWINDDPANPIITHMNIGWSIELSVVD